MKEHLSALTDKSSDIKTSTLLELSGLADKEFDGFVVAWREIDSETKVEILTRLTELAEDNVQLDFSLICRLSLSDEKPAVRKAALDGLWEIQDRAFIMPIVEILLNDIESDVKASAAICLSSFAQLSQNKKLIDRDTKKVFHALINTINANKTEIDVTRRSLEALGYFSGTIVDETLSTFHKDKNPLLKQSAIYAMGRNAQLKWLAIIMEDFKNENPAIRFEALNAAGYLGGESIVLNIIPFTNDEDTQVQVAALTALGYIGGELAKREILLWTEDTDENIRDAAMNALSNIDFDQDPLGLTLR